MREDDEKRPLPQLGSTPAPTEKPDLKRRILESKQRILSGMKGKYTGEETSRWLTSIEENPTNAEETISVGGLVDESRLSMPALLDLLFDHLQRYSFELNKVATDPDMKINCERPTSWQEKVEYMTKTRFMRGHLSTRYYSFMVWAEEGKADGYIIPTEFMVGFSPLDFTPYISISRMPSGAEDIIWGIDKKVLSSHEVPKLARRLITQLVKVCTGEANPDDRFTFSSADSVVQPTVSIDRSYEFELEGQIGQSGLQSVDGSAPQESRSQRLKRLMEESARQEDQDRAAGLGFKRPVTVAERPPAPGAGMDSGTFRAPGNGHEAVSASGSYPADKGAPGAIGSTPTFQGFMPPGKTALPTPPGAIGSPGQMGQSMPPGALGQPPAAPGQPPQAPGLPPGLGQPPPPPPGNLGMPPGLAQSAPAPAPTFLQPPGGLSLGPPPGFGDGAPGAPPPAPIPGAQTSDRIPAIPPSPPGTPVQGFSSDRIPAIPPTPPGVPPQGLSSDRVPAFPPAPPAGAPQALSSERIPTVPSATAPGDESSPTLRPPSSLFGGPPSEPAARVNSNLLPDESGMFRAIPEPAPGTETEPPSPWSSLNFAKPDSANAPTPPADARPSLSDVTRAPADPTPAPTPAPEAPPAELPPAAPPPSSAAVSAFAPPKAPVEPPPEAPAAPAAAAEAPRGLAGLVRKSALNDAAPPSPRKESAAVQVDFGSPEEEPAPEPVPAPAPASEPVVAAHEGRKPTLQSLLSAADDQSPPISSDANDITKLVNDAQKNALGNISGIIQELDRAMKSLQEAGVEAMQSGNFESVQLVMENTKRLKATRERLSQLLDEISAI